jgi:major membrane immunogen (membrane-anchored lipoprotein)
MYEHSTHKELHDPFAHYTRGVLHFDDETFTFTAYRVPYQELDNKKWKSERAFTADYQRMIARKYSV